MAAAELVDRLAEQELQSNARRLLKPLGLTILQEKPRIGAYEPDVIAVDRDRTLVVVEFKTERKKEALAQLLLYRHALQDLLSADPKRPPRVRAMLVSTFIDENVLAVAETLPFADDLSFYAVIGTSIEQLSLMPARHAPPAQLGKQHRRGPNRLRIREDSVAGWVSD